MPANKPTQYVQWNPSQSNVTQPPDSLRARGWQANEAPLAQHMNWVLYLQDQWTQYFDDSLASTVMATTLDASMRLLGGGTFSFALGTGTLTFTQPLTLAIPSLADAANQIAAGSIVIAPGQVAYVQANVPFSATGDVTSGQATVQNLAFDFGVQVGQTVTGAGIPSGTTVLSISGTTVTLSQNATATAQQTPLTFSGTGALTLQVASAQTLIPSANTVIVARAQGAALYVGVNSGQMILRDGEQKRLLETGYQDVRYPTAGTALSALQAIHISTGANGRTLGAAYLAEAASANAVTRSICMGFAISAAAAGAQVPVVTGGTLPGFTGLTTGATYYLDAATPGAITTTAPTGLNYAVSVGLAVSTTTLYVRIQTASGAPILDPSYNSVTVQPVTGDASAVQVAIKDAGGTNKLLVDATGNVSHAGNLTTAGNNVTAGSITGGSFVSPVGFRQTLGPAMTSQSATANNSLGSANSPLGMAETNNVQIWQHKLPFAGSLVGMTVSYRYTAAVSPAPTIYVQVVKNNGASVWSPSFNSNNTGAGIDYGFNPTLPKGTTTFVPNDVYQVFFYTSTFAQAANFLMKVVLWVETAA